MPVRRFVPIVMLAGLALAGCSAFTDVPESCPAAPGQGITSNAPQDGTTGASGTSATSNGLGSTIDPTAPPCRPAPRAPKT
jgi:hypothetical protein